MRKFGLMLIGFLATGVVFGQRISGNVKDQDSKALAGSTVSLLNAKDSSVVKLALSNNDGQFSFSGIKVGRYLVSATHVGYKQGFTTSFENSVSGETNVPLLQLGKLASELKGVTVSSKKPIVEVKADRTVLNVEGTINATGSDALELLRKSPGVTVDKDDNISLSGKNGVQVYIDGKPTPLTGSDLANYLKSLQSAQIESIELITNPSAKYEAAGNAGIINIRLKKNKTFGFNGSVNAGWNIATYPKYNAGGAINYRYKKLNVFGTYNYSNNRNESRLNLYRTTSADSSFDQKTTMVNKNETNNFKAGADYYANNKSTFGVMANGNFSNNHFNSLSKTDIAYMPSKEIDRLLIADNSSQGRRENVNFNVNYRFADTSGHELNVDADYGFYNGKNNQYQPNDIYDASGNNLKFQEVYHTLTPYNIDIYSIKADYEQRFRKGKLGYGGKISYVNTDNTFQRFFESSSGLLEDNHNNFTYKENINAGYVNYNRQFKGVMVQAGLRVENTHSTGHSSGFRYDYNIGSNVAIDSSFDRAYTDPFPSAAITFNKNPMKQWSISYSRRIDRPSYQNLNPFEFNLDKYTFQRGNPDLRPQYTNSVGITHIYKYRLTTTLNYSHVNDVFTMIPKSEGTKAFITNENVATQDIVSLNVSMPIQYKWYSLFFNVNSYYSKFKGDATDYHVDVDVFSFNVYAQQTFKLAKKTTAELSGFYTAPSIWQGAFKTKQLGSLDVGVQQTVFKGKGTLKGSVTDVLNTFHWSATNNTTGQLVKANGGWESRQFKINLNYRFGNNKIKQARQRKTSIEEETQRTQGGGGLGGGQQQK
ncbi:MAG TPA: outer membrane beta-barrel protein [Chitinophagaceae bacterium]|nr:outer membrane beta-barrel protein [Chitinophagaceae bacterium]